MQSEAGIAAVIPTYNSYDLVRGRIQELQSHNFQRIVVCDDASTDGTPEGLQQEYGDTIEVIAGAQNLGPGSNRNRILNHLKGEDLLFFVDADCKIIYEEDLINNIMQAFVDAKTGVVGFGIMNKASQPMRWNYGALMHPVHEAAGQVLEMMLDHGELSEDQFRKYAPNRAASFRMAREAGQMSVGWVAEGCFAIRAGLFRELGGFDKSMRYHETHDLNARSQNQGYETVFCPEPVAVHLDYNTRLHRRDNDERDARLRYYQKHWGMSESVFRRLFDERE